MITQDAVEPRPDPTQPPIQKPATTAPQVLPDGVQTTTEPGSPNPNSNTNAVEPKQNPVPVPATDPDGSGKTYNGGLGNALKEFLPTQAEDDDNTTKNEEGEIISIDGITEEEFEKAKEIIFKDDFAKAEDKDKLFTGFSDEQIQSLKEAYADKFNPQVLNTKLEDLEPPQLIEEVKKNQRLVSERLKEIEALKTELETFKANGNGQQKTQASNPEVEQFINELKINPASAWDKYRAKFDLPDKDLLSASLSSNPEKQLKAWQETQLKPEIEKKFNLEKGEFEVVKEDLYEPGTPSYAFRKATEAKEREQEQVIANTRQSESQMLEQIKAQQIEDIKFIAENDLGGDLEKAEALFNELNALPIKIVNGEVPAERSPYAIRNLIRGVFHDQLMAQAKAEVENDIIKQFNEKGMYLPDKELPTDITKIKTTQTTTTPVTATKEQLEYSPMLRTIMQDIQ